MSANRPFADESAKAPSFKSEICNSALCGSFSVRRREAFCLRYGCGAQGHLRPSQYRRAIQAKSGGASKSLPYPRGDVNETSLISCSIALEHPASTFLLFQPPSDSCALRICVRVFVAVDPLLENTTLGRRPAISFEEAHVVMRCSATKKHGDHCSMLVGSSITAQDEGRKKLLCSDAGAGNTRCSSSGFGSQPPLYARSAFTGRLPTQREVSLRRLLLYHGGLCTF